MSRQQLKSMTSWRASWGSETWNWVSVHTPLTCHSGLYCTLVWYDCRMCSCAWCVCPLSASLLPPLFPLSLPPSLSFLPPYSLLTSLYSLLPLSPVCLLTPSSLPSLLLVATTMVDLGRDKSSVDDYALAMDDILGDFEFPDDFLIDCWKAIETVKAAATT